MVRPLQPATEAGLWACRQAEEHAAVFAAEAAQHDRAGRFPVGHVRALQASGLAGATVPADLGGGGVDRLRDLMVVAGRLAWGDGSLGICTSMHLSSCWSLARAARSGLEPAASLLEGVAGGKVWLSAAVTEAGTNYFHPHTTLVGRPEDGGWTLDGDKVFATGSVAATHLTVNARWGDRLATVIVPVDRPGVEVLDDWDGLGMRASGSGRVRFRAAWLGGDALVLPGGPWGAFSAVALCGRAWGNVGNVAASAGIAEAAGEGARQRIRGEGRISSEPLAARATVRHALAGLDVRLHTLEAVLARLADEADETAADPPTDLAAAHAFMASFQRAKLVTNRLAIEVVDLALDLAGGQGYSGGHPAGRRYRDVRAGPFMQPFSPHEALGYIGAVAAGVEPDVEA
jgi:alkylation response protein AidB-like acyl-CoA dehydrogenase